MSFSTKRNLSEKSSLRACLCVFAILAFLLTLPEISSANPNRDDDGDGYSENQGDCDDTNPSIHTGATEVCDGIDNNCNGNIDENASDSDGDSYTTCGDCDDSNSAINPGNTEVCDGLDNDCDGQVDEGFTDVDGDGYCNDDCNDSDEFIHPGAAEVCDGVDNNCNGARDEGFTDADNDGYAACGGDCNDANPYVNPATPEVQYNGTNDDCNSETRDLDWQIEMLERDWDIYYETSIALDVTNNVHISFYLWQPSFNLKYLTNKSGAWISINRDYTGDVGRYSSITADSSNRIHFSYYDVTNGDLKYAINSPWTTTTIDSTGDVGLYTSIATDSSGYVHISYYDATNADLKYATNATGSWVLRTIESAGDTGRYSSIAVDASDHIHISYEDYTHSELKYISDITGWTGQTVSAAGRYGPTSIAVDPQGAVHISHSGKYATNATGAWVVSSIDLESKVWDSSLALDSADNVYISYVYWGSNQFLKLASNASGAWKTETVDNPGHSVGQYNSITVDASGNIYISYIDWESGDLKYAFLNVPGSDHDGDGYPDTQGDCNDADALVRPEATEICDGRDNNCDGTVDEGFPDADGDLFASCGGDCNDNDASVNPRSAEICGDGTDNNCDGNIDEDTDSDGDGYSICNDCNDSNPDVNPGKSEIHHNGIDDDCSETSPDFGWIDVPVIGDSIAIDSSDNIHVVYRSNNYLIYATNVSGGWVHETLDYEQYFGVDSPSVAVDSSGHAHISYEKYGSISYATNASGVWVISSIDSGTEYTAIAVDSSDNVHIIYKKTSGLTYLMYAENTTGSWAAEIVDSATSYPLGKNPSIAVDSSGRAHISYEYVGIKYATNTSGAWVVESVDSGTYPSVALDSSGNPHISYYNSSTNQVRMAAKISGAWITDVVADNVKFGPSSGATSIAIDQADTVHISYAPSAKVSPVVYATNGSGIWVRESMNFNGYVTDIALDSWGMAHIVSVYGYATNASYRYYDDDGDGYTEIQGDCNDRSSTISPGAAEICDGIDNNCNGAIDEGFDSDSDGYTICESDCDDSNLLIHPTAPELCDGIDNNCDGTLDEGFEDADGDGYGVCAGDCNENNNEVHPNTPELCDSIDNNCDGAIDEGFPDADGDGHAACGADCNDSDAAVSPDRTEIPYNGKDDDCNASTLDDDLDNDGYVIAVDCNDSAPAVNPSAVEICDGTDNNCDGTIDEDVDRDGDTYSVCGGDCNDSNSSVNPDAAEIPYNGIDDDCSPSTPDYIWTMEQIDAGEDVVGGGALKIDLSGYIHFAYYNMASDRRYATNVSGSWISETLDSSVMTWADRIVMAVDAAGNAHIVYVKYIDGYYYPEPQFFYVTNSSGNWIKSALYHDDANAAAMSIDSEGTVNVTANNSGGMWYWSNVTGSFEVSIIGSNYSHASMASVSPEQVHIVSKNQYNIVYLTNISGTWVEQNLDSVGTENTIAVDSAGHVHVCYYDDVNNKLKYASDASGSWTIQVVDTSGGKYPSLALDASDNPHISYYDGLDQVKHASYISGTWVHETLDSGISSSHIDHTSLSIDKEGNIHIGYYDIVDDFVRHISNVRYIDDDADGYSAAQGDCDDTDASINPGAVETWYDGTDQDCDGRNDYDADMDTYVETAWNAQSGGTSPNTDDCDDSNALLTPLTYWHPDSDGDSFGNPTTSLQQCIQPAGYVLDSTDCDDSNPDIHGGGLPARVLGATTDYYTTIQAAYDAAGDGYTIQGQEVTFTGDLNIDLSNAVMIQGGYDCGYSEITGNTIINGDIIISGGRVTIENLIVN